MSNLTSDEREELLRLRALINNPETQDYLKGVEAEAAHQQERWGSGHDAGKADADWVFLIGFLLGKSVQAFKAGDEEKGRHHIISAGAAGLNWFRQISGRADGVRPGIDPSKAPDADEYLLQDTRHHVGNCPLWWKKGGGYTSRIDCADRFSLARAMAQHRVRESDLPWLAREIEPLQRPTIDFQDFPRGHAQQREALERALQQLS